MQTISPIPLEEVSIDYVRASGPGGQNVNKVATAAQLRFDLRRTSALNEAVKQRLARLAGRRMTSEGVLVITARRFRTQEANRADALRRLRELVERASLPPKARHATAVPRSAREKRLERKKRQAGIKQTRRSGTAVEPD